jgi:peroxiredoxin
MSSLTNSNANRSPGTDPRSGLNDATNANRRNTIWIIGLAIIFVFVFCGGFVYFYLSRQAKHASALEVGTAKPLPSAQLIDESNQILPDSELRRGKLILVFVTTDCDACLKESEFLRTVVGKRSNMPFYGVVSFGDKDISLREGKDKFPFKLLYDEHHQLAGSLGIVKVPIKLFVEDGLIKKSWGGAMIDEQAKATFVKWLEEQR